MRLEQHRTEHPAGRQPQRPPEEPLGQLSEAELRALAVYRSLPPHEKALLRAGLRHRALAPLFVRLLIMSRVSRKHD